MTSDSYAAAPGSRAIIYLRVSTGKQAEKDLSIPDQRKQLRAHCKHHAYSIVGEYKDAKSGRNDKRAGFQEMIDEVIHGGINCDLIIVHSYSRFFRDGVYSELYFRELAKKGVRVISLTQKADESAEGQLVRRIIAIFDEFQSLETSKHVRRSLHENASQGFWCGGTTPFGYRVVEVEKRGKTSKKGLAIAEDEAAVVNLIFDLATSGDATSAPMGVKSIASWLTERGYKTRNGKNWRTSTVHRRLSDRTYTGEFIYSSKQGDGEDIIIRVPEIISREHFDRLQEIRTSRDPQNTPPRIVTGEVLLTGLVKCPHCGSGMTTSTGKGGRYRYYKCAGQLGIGDALCYGRRVPMEKMDDFFLTAFLEDFLTVKNVGEILAPLMRRQSASTKDLTDRISTREQVLSTAMQQLDNLYSLVTQGLVDAVDDDFQQRFQAAKSTLKTAEREKNQVTAELAPEAKVNIAATTAFVSQMRTALAQPSNSAKRAYLRSLIDVIVVGEKTIQVHGRRSQIERAVVRGKVDASAVPTFVREWRRRWDSNPRYALTHAGFQDQCIRPLCHSSAAQTA
jgi:site-specific DNA recombinase